MTDTICIVCGQNADQHFTSFVNGFPQVGSYDAQGNSQLCSVVRAREIEVSEELAARIEHIQVINIPPCAYLFVSLNPDVLDVDIARIRKELQEFFGPDRKIAIARAGDVQLSVITFEEAPNADR